MDLNYATGHHWYAEHLAFEGRFREAQIEMQRALQLDPLSLIIKSDQGMLYYFARQYDRAITQLHEVLEMEPGFSRAHMIVFPYLESGRPEEALAGIENWKHTELNYWIPSLEVQVYARTNRPAQAQRALEELKKAAPGETADPEVYVGAYVALKDYERAFAKLDESVAKHSPVLTSLRVEPMYDPLRGDPRFQAILVRIGLGQ